jgi:hypothetical protein
LANLSKSPNSILPNDLHIDYPRCPTRGCHRKAERENRKDLQSHEFTLQTYETSPTSLARGLSHKNTLRPRTYRNCCGTMGEPSCGFIGTGSKAKARLRQDRQRHAFSPSSRLNQLSPILDRHS